MNQSQTAQSIPAQGAVGSVTQWLAQPFNGNGSALNWVLFLGLLLCAVFFWTRVLAHITRSLEV